MKQWYIRPLLWWAYSAIMVTGLCALVHVAVQQDLRQGANDPQVQMAEDAAARLEGGAAPADVVPRAAPPVDIATSLSPWLAVYDQSGALLAASGQLNGAPPQLPAGVFDTSGWKSIVGHHLTVFYPNNENRFTWQPKDGVRQAVVLVHFSGGLSEHGSIGSGFVAAGRSLREVESRESQLTLEVFVLWALTLLCLLVASFVADRLARK